MGTGCPERKRAMNDEIYVALVVVNLLTQAVLMLYYQR
jgi:hypothetical protein